MVASQSIPEVQPAQRPPIARRMRNCRPAPAPGSCLGDLPIPLKRRGDGVVNNYGYRYFHPELGRWLSRDPIGELGGINLYSVLKNSCIHSVDLFGLFDVTGDSNYITISIKRDSSVKEDRKTWTDREKILFDSITKFLQEKLTECCCKYPKTCTMMEVKEDRMNEKIDSPGKYYRANFAKFAESSVKGVIPVLLTKTQIINANTLGLAAGGSGIILIPNESSVLAHELGHVAGWGSDLARHSQRPSNLMAESGGKEVDEEWCKKVAALGVKRTIIYTSNRFEYRGKSK